LTIASLQEKLPILEHQLVEIEAMRRNFAEKSREITKTIAQTKYLLNEISKQNLEEVNSRFEEKETHQLMIQLSDSSPIEEILVAQATIKQSKAHLASKQIS
jgi:hypothetical protein